MRTNLLELLCKKSAISYIIFDSSFHIIEAKNVDVQKESDIRDFLWEIIGMEEPILALRKHNTPIEIPMIFRKNCYYDLEIDTFHDTNKRHYFIAYMQKKSHSTKEYANVLREINKKTLIYDLSDEKKDSAYFKEINKHLITFHIDLDGFVLRVNDAALHFFNLEREAFLRQHFSEFFQLQKAQNNNSNIFLAKNSLNEDIFFHTEIIPVTDMQGKIKENIIVAQDITHLKKIKKDLEYAQEHDALTGLANRHAFLKRVDALIEKKKNFSLSFIDIDNFSKINEEYGAHAGDMLLKHLTELLLTFLDPQDLLLRLHKDSFVIIFDPQKTKEYIQKLDQSLRSLSLDTPLYYNSEDIIHFNYTTLLLHFPDDANNAQEFLQNAQKILKRKKIEKRSKEKE